MSVIQFAPEITKEFIFQRVSEEEIFERYGIPVVDYQFCSPLRDDKHPTCSFYRRRRDNRLVMRDLAGYFWGDCIDLVMLQTQKKYHDALRDIAVTFKLVSGTQAVIRKPAPPKVDIKQFSCEIRVKRMQWTREHYAFWEQFLIGPDTLAKYNVSPLEQAWLNGSQIYWYGVKKEIAFCYYFGGYDYKLYFPIRERGKLRFLHNNPNILQGYEQLPESGEFAVITKSLKDVMALDEFNIPGVAPMAETMIISDAVFEDLSSRFTHLFSLYDSVKPETGKYDAAGISSMQAMKRKYNITPLSFGKNQPKDFSDFTKKFGRQDTLILIDQVKSIYLD